MAKTKISSLTADEWREQLEPFDSWNRRLILATFGLFGIPGSYLDVGSGTGAMVDIARSLGINALGIDAIAQTPDKIVDLTGPVNLDRQFSLVTCIEVAEHIAPFHSEILCGNIARHVEDGGVLIFTAAAPGQAGEGHVNLRLSTVWRSWLYDRRLWYREDMTFRLKLAWQLIPMPMMWLPDNVQVFGKVPVEAID